MHILPFVVVSGLPASGKTTVARELARSLGLPLISKDAIKEALFDTLGFGDWERSKAFSRAADAAMVRVAQELDAAVLDNFWHAETVRELLAPLPQPMIEVFCSCDPDVALARFRSRDRHPGHVDHLLDPDIARADFARRLDQLPLGLVGPAIRVDTEQPVDIDALAAHVLQHSTPCRRRS